MRGGEENRSGEEATVDDAIIVTITTFQYKLVVERCFM